ncbi:MAG: hypothetical protein QNK92_08935 [Amylibacter sp.]
MGVPDFEDRCAELRQRLSKSNVLIVVTYFVVFMYCTTAVVLTFVLLFWDQIELALAVFSGLSTLSAGVAGFWFGNRNTGHPEEMPTPLGKSERAVSSNLLNPENASLRPNSSLDDEKKSPKLNKDETNTKAIEAELPSAGQETNSINESLNDQDQLRTSPEFSRPLEVTKNRALARGS